ncbi:undecaprenyl-diphosphatase [Paenibacillus sp. 1_12]|uniref:phosphatase PAP2 family protein n=1 Tax=Paenibacillus sp. 1_12 TaxID=1566278 RepID=UPI0008E11B7F|nr:phosphatase PAP2 family protein [Paenibacillus sp. 1_12]SFL54316.1 undecaprenyl-diphosphatase [Paenibacillus sp. 1_12]
MNIKQQLASAFIISVICAVCFGLIALLIHDRRLDAFDQTILQWIQGLESPALTNVMKGFTLIGSGMVVAILVPSVAVFLYFVLGHRRELVFFIGVIIGSSLLNEVLKIIFHRARPTIHRIIEATGYSFPSGHSMAAFTLYGVVTFLLWRHVSSVFKRSMLILFSMLMILMIGISRIYLGVHYPSDVLGGYMVSGSWLAASIWFFHKYGYAGAAKKVHP